MLVSFLYESFISSDNPRAFFASNNLVVPSALFSEVGGFDTRFPFAAGEDRDLCERLVSAGGELVFVPDARVRHCHEMGLGEFLRQQYSYGRGARQLRRLRRHRDGLDRSFETVGFYLRLVLYPSRFPPRWRVPLLCSLLAIGQVATFAGYAREALFSSFRREPDGGRTLRGPRSHDP